MNIEGIGGSYRGGPCTSRRLEIVWCVFRFSPTGDEWIHILHVEFRIATSEE